MSAILVQLDKLRSNLHNSSLLKKYCDMIENTIHVRIEYMVTILALVPTVMLFYGYKAQAISDLVGFVYPLYATILAIEVQKKEDNMFWLSYWVVYGFVYMLEEFIDYFHYWLPFYYPLKVVFFLWLYLPQYAGANQVYANVILPYFKHLEKHVDDIFGFK
jgi:receptor expression-enhancing protein 5/6